MDNRLVQGVRDPEAQHQRGQKQRILGPDHAGSFRQLNRRIRIIKGNFQDLVGKPGENNAQAQDKDSNPHIMTGSECTHDDKQLPDENTEGWESGDTGKPCEKRYKSPGHAVDQVPCPFNQPTAVAQ